MTLELDLSHDPDLESWVDSAAGSEFPIQNLPYGAFRLEGDERSRLGVAIGDQVLDLFAAAKAGLLEGLAAADACSEQTLNALMALPGPSRQDLRLRLVELLRAGAPQRAAAAQALVAAADAHMGLPAVIGDYTDFYASVHHATNVGGMFRPDNPLLPNYKWIPIGYHGRASSVVISNTPVRRPRGQTIGEVADGSVPPSFGPSRLLDYEMEVGMLIGPGNTLGEAVPLEQADEHLFGFCLVNDWSARDLQKWEYQPLGPFLAKSFATTVSPWVVTTEALVPYRVPVFERPPEDPEPLPYLDSEDHRASGGLALTVEVWLRTAGMRASGAEPVRLSQASYADMYWTAAQMVTHHTSNGCNLRPGDLLASGTVSGPEKENRGCLLELTWRGAEPVELPGGEIRRFLQDGDEVILRGFCEAPGRVRIGFGECRGVVAPAETDG